MPFSKYNDKELKDHLLICSCDDSIFPKNSRNILNILGDGAIQGWWDWHIEEDFEYISPGWWEVLGYDPKDMPHHPDSWKKIINKDDLDVWTNDFLAKVNNNNKEIIVSHIVRYTKKDGGIAHLICQGKVIEWGENGPKRMIGTHTDVTEYIKKAQDSDAQQATIEQQLTSLSKFPEENSNPVMRIADDGTLMYANPAAIAQLADWNLESGNSASGLLLKAAKSASKKSVEDQHEIRYRDRTYAFAIAHVKDEGYANFYGRDITDHKRSEEERFAANQQLQASNQRLTAMEQKLRAANQQLQASNQQLSVMAQQLRAANQQLTALSKFPEENNNPVMRIANDGTLIYANPAAISQLADWGLVSGRTSPEDILNAVKATSQKGSEHRSEIRYRERIYSFVIAPVKDAGYANLYGRDITENKRMEKEYKKEKEMIADFFGASETGLAIVKPNGDFIKVNKSFCNITGYSSKHLLTTSFQNITHKDDIANDMKSIQSMLNKEINSYSHNKRYVKPDGTAIWTNLTVVAYYTKNGEVEKFFAQIININDKFEKEKKIKQSIKSLQKIIKENGH